MFHLEIVFFLSVSVVFKSTAQMSSVYCTVELRGLQQQPRLIGFGEVNEFVARVCQLKD